MKYARLLYEDDPFEDFNPQQSIPIEQRIASRDNISCFYGLKSAIDYMISFARPGKDSQDEQTYLQLDHRDGETK
jgi:hypothetical protein